MSVAEGTVAVAHAAAPSDSGVAAARIPRALLIAICLGAFAGMADATIVAVGLAPLTQHFGVALSAGQEVLALYLVVVTAALPTLGRLADRIGRRRVYLSGFAIFAAASALCAVAPSFWMLLTGRALQALGGAMLTAGSLALMAEHAGSGRTGRSVALLVMMQALSGLLGPPLGGLLVALGGWQTIFWVGLPVGLFGLVLGLLVIPVTNERREGGLDIPGALLLALALAGIGAGISSLDGPVLGGVPAPVWLSIAWISTLLFVPAELISKRPIIDGRLFRQPRFAAASVASFLSTGTLMSSFALLPYWLESAHHASAILAGLAFLPIGFGIGALSHRGGKLSDAGHTRLATGAGMGLAATGFLTAALAAQLDAWWLLVIGLFVLGCGNGLFSSPNTSAAVRVAPRRVLGSAAAFLSTARNAGVIVGLSVTGAIYTAATRGATVSAADGVATGLFIAAACICVCVGILSSRAYR